jgi:hypothetical protein
MDPVTLASLIAAACNGLVAAAVTDSWEEVRRKVASWFGRGQADSKALARLDATRTEIASAGPAERGRVQDDLAREWAGRFKDLIVEHPDAADDLSGLVGEIRAITVNAAGHSVAAGGDVTITADRGGVAAGRTCSLSCTSC